MFPPESFSAGVHSGLPLQLSLVDFFGDLADPLPLRLDQGDLVLQLDQGKAWVRLQKLIEQTCEFCADRVKSLCTLLEEPTRLIRLQVVHEHQPSGEVLVLATRLGDDLAHD